jgi:DNA-binding XRE family transcriptional regulator
LTPQQLKKARHELKLTQAELAKAFSISRNSIINMERGRHRMPGWITHAMAGLKASMSKT